MGKQQDTLAKLYELIQQLTDEALNAPDGAARERAIHQLEGVARARAAVMYNGQSAFSLTAAARD